MIAVIASTEPFPLLKAGGHKYDHGHALIVAGGPGQGGAARLAARAALRIGAGLVTLAPPLAAMSEHTGPPDALMRRALDDPADLASPIHARRINAIAIGPGCGIGRAARLLPALLATGLPCLLDADALTALSRTPVTLHAQTVMTPHRGEFARLFPDIALPNADSDAAAQKRGAVQAAQRSGAVVLLKGPITAIATPDGSARCNDARDAPWLATAGSGDVLAGIIAGLLARGAPPPEAAALGAYIHAECARRFGPGLIADDLPEQIPGLLRDMA